jgi:hypothetical protein
LGRFSDRSPHRCRRGLEDLAATRPERVTALIASGAIGARDYSEPDERAHVERRAAVIREHGLDDVISGLEETEATTFPD